MLRHVSGRGTGIFFHERSDDIDIFRTELTSTFRHQRSVGIGRAKGSYVHRPSGLSIGKAREKKIRQDSEVGTSLDC